jgi:hypothetical protein
MGSGVLETVDVAKPTKEDKIRRKAKNAQRKLDKERGAGIRRNHDGIGKLIDTESRKKTRPIGRPNRQTFAGLRRFV